MAKTGNTIIALAAGAALGAIAGILYAPESGKKTRKKLKKEAIKAKDTFTESAQRTYEQVAAKTSEVRGTVGERIDEALSTASYKADDAIVALEEKLEQLRTQNAKLQKPKSVSGAVKKAKATV
ncbi:YtxH domain-containing protein [Nonlabens sp. SY33080]|uniref:YtxH domain-containing protein n=1 Tax=Nonlabens sp. SY33080 TaxID=2719911 RepID=UPI001428988F|nr:YtxH domain-containing protein [Nonlabens sp. SY33080]